jgi:hypothetical protein
MGPPETHRVNDVLSHSSKPSIAHRVLVAIVMIVFLLQLLIRYFLLNSPDWHRQWNSFPDIDLYFKYAHSFGDGFVVGGAYALRTPGWPAMISLDHRLLLLTFMGGANVVWVYLIGRWLQYHGAPAETAPLAALLFMLEPFSFVLSVIPLSETAFTFFFLAFVYTFCRWCTAPSLGKAGLLGLMAGLALYVRPSVLAVWLVAWIVAVVSSFIDRTDRSRWMTHSAVALAAFVLAMSPWWIRNYRVFGTFVLTTTSVGESLYDGWNPRGDGSSNFWFKGSDATKELSEVEADRHWRNEAIAWAKENPSRVLELACLKFLRFWSPVPNEPRFQDPISLIVTAGATVPIYLLAILGWWVASKTPIRRVAGYSLIPIVTFCLLHLIFVSSVRYRVPIMPIFSLWAGVALASLLAWMSPKDTSPVT